MMDRRKNPCRGSVPTNDFQARDTVGEFKCSPASIATEHEREVLGIYAAAHTAARVEVVL